MWAHLSSASAALLPCCRRVSSLPDCRALAGVIWLGGWYYCMEDGR